MRRRDIYYDHNTMYMVLHYKFVEDLKNYQIAKEVGISPSTVAEYLDIARELEFYKVFIDFAPESKAAKELMLTFGLRNVVVSPSEFGLHELALLGARFLVKEVIRDDISITVGGGTNIWKMVCSLPTLAKERVQIYSMCVGDHFLAEISSSMVANVLFYRLYEYGGKLHVFPAFANLNADPPDRNCEVYSNAANADVFLVPFGSIEEGTGGRVVKQEFRLDIANLRKNNVVGFCGYHLITGDGEHYPSKEIEERVFSIDLESLRKASFTEGKYVIGVAFGEQKTHVVKAALRKGYINTLFIDDKLARALLEDE